MSPSTQSKPVPPCGCERCLCRRGPLCRCHAYNALLALVLWDYGRIVRRRRAGA